MARNEETEAFHYAVYDEVQKIPFGKVTSYSHIAKLIYRPQNPRQVGQLLKVLPKIEVDPELSKPYKFHTKNVPWWRVVNAKGEISPRSGEGPLLQKDLLHREGVQLNTGGCVDLIEHGYFPQTDFD